MYKNFTKLLARELVRCGLWGPSSEKIKEDLHDHYINKVEALQAQGLSPKSAERNALQALGTPMEVAREASRQLSRSSWFWRQTWLSAIGLPFLLGLCLKISVTVFFLLVPGLHPSRSLHGHDYSSAMSWDRFFSLLGWLSWLIAVVMLSRFSLYFSIGWKRLSAAALSLALGTTMVSFSPLVSINPGGWAQLPFLSVAYLVGGASLCHDLGYHGFISFLEEGLGDVTSWSQLSSLAAIPWIVRWREELAILRNLLVD